VSEERSQAEQTNYLRALEPRGLEFRCGPAPERLPVGGKHPFTDYSRRLQSEMQ
jgi:hypothetical protein